jgi:signal transduction histidine kinase
VHPHHARVETHLKLHRLQQELKSQNERLEETVAARTHELAEANERLMALDRSKNEFLNLISHEFRTPLHGLLGVGDVILEEMPPTEENAELRELFEHSRRRILSILDDALLLTQIDVSGEQFKSGQVSIRSVLSLSMDRIAEFAGSRRVAITPPPAILDLAVQGDEALLVRAFQVLLETAVGFSEVGETVRLMQEALPDSFKVIIESRGETVPIAVLPKFFDLFSIEESSTPGRDLGLGPAVASRILSLFGGSISVANRDPSGIRLTISLNVAG